MTPPETVLRVSLPRWAALALAAALVLVTAGPIAAMLIYFAIRAPGEKIASVTPIVGQPFELEYTSDGRAQRVWIDVTCTRCDPNAVEGTLVARSATGATLASARVQEPLTGYSASGSEDETQGRYSVEGHPVMDVPAQPAGARIVVSGTLSPEPRRVYELGPVRLNERHALPRIESLSVWIAR